MRIEPLVVIQVEITKIIVETNVSNIIEYIHFIFCHFPRILGMNPKVQRGVMLRGLDDYMILNE